MGDYVASAVTVKTEVGLIDGTPEKRVFWSLIADYGLRTGLCELVDNALDLWMLHGRAKPLNIKIDLDTQRQMISIEDDAGGVTAVELRLLIAPGGSRNASNAPIIGVFGVGSKRASVAIGEHVEIRTRHKFNATFQLDITRDWLETPDWSLPSYQIANIAPGTTRVEISKLRRPFTDDDIDHLQTHFAETYSWFINEGCSIKVNGEPLAPIKFDSFAFPPSFAPQTATFNVALPGLGNVGVKITAGLILDRNAEAENYGVYFYCNHRLVVKEFRTRDVGYFVTREAGVPHPDASLARVIVELDGAARAMPWNSSKSGIDPDHPLFHHIRPTIIYLNSHFSSLSRRLKSDWESQVFKHTDGKFEEAVPTASGTVPRFVLPPLPRVHKSRAEHLMERNKAVIKRQPWTLGLVESIAAVDVVLKQRFDTKNRMAMILLDSNFEIALKEFIVHRTDLFPPTTYTDASIATLFAKRNNVINSVKAALPALPQNLIDLSKHYYLMRNKIIHERASVGITDNDVATYRATVQSILGILFNIKF